ncbi:NAD(P)/FAD-dependent oxidoreductase [Halalkalirubrum salinum]|uniref:NAD(P)/FAD-dependent oxidoreductase n=1 Tax=Halalkalirubrum salinum TaxID=2563889 RepID=UPI0010FB3298|nr:NAD(P)/FAD-dependent oxidoreductase [Halalkalirubrum salinum]
MRKTSVVVVGGGLAGLVAARRLAAAGCSVTLYERRETVGGRVQSREQDGFVLDRGFQVLFTAYPAVQAELDLDALDLRPFKPGAVIARPGERSTLSDPLRDPAALFESLLNREITFTDKVRTLALRQDLAERPPASFFSGHDTTIAEYLDEWGFSQSYIQNFISPFYGGITLDRSLSTSKEVFAYTFKMLSTGQIALPAAGMGAIADQLAEAAQTEGVRIETGDPVNSIEETCRHAVVDTEHDRRKADAVVVATSPKAAMRLTGVESIPTEAVGSVTQYYRHPTDVPLDTGNRLVLNAANASPNTVVPLSSIAPEYGTDDAELLCATFLGSAAQSRSDVALAADTREALASWYPERSFEGLEPIATDRIPFSQFAQPPGFFESLPDVRSPDGRCYLAGDYTRWSSIQGAMESGQVAANAVLEDQ